MHIDQACFPIGCAKGMKNLVIDGLYNVQCNVQTNSSAMSTSINNTNNSDVPVVVPIGGQCIAQCVIQWVCTPLLTSQCNGFDNHGNQLAITGLVNAFLHALWVAY